MADPVSKRTRCSRFSPEPEPKPEPEPQPKSASPDRVLTDVLLAIKPEHLANITSRQKNHEYRKYRLKDGVSRLWLYETGGGGGRSSITHVQACSVSLLAGSSCADRVEYRHIVIIPPSTRHEPGSVRTEPFGIGNVELNAGLKESKYGYPILELYELVSPVSLGEMKSRWRMGGAPMGWRHVGADLWEGRWGEDDARDEKVTKMF